MTGVEVTKEKPEETTGYDVNLRNEHWGWLGFPTD